jgi:hypothetical protein
MHGEGIRGHNTLHLRRQIVIVLPAWVESHEYAIMLTSNG